MHIKRKLDILPVYIVFDFKIASEANGTDSPPVSNDFSINVIQLDNNTQKTNKIDERNSIVYKINVIDTIYNFNHYRFFIET